MHQGIRSTPHPCVTALQMAKLTNLKPTLGSLPTRLGSSPLDERQRDRKRRQRQSSKQWLNSKWWRDTRQRILLRDMYTCQMCGRLITGKGEATVDHIKPHRENKELFFCSDEGLQTLCTSPCHAKHKQQQEQGEW